MRVTKNYSAIVQYVEWLIRGCGIAASTYHEHINSTSVNSNIATVNWYLLLFVLYGTLNRRHWCYTVEKTCKEKAWIGLKQIYRMKIWEFMIRKIFSTKEALSNIAEPCVVTPCLWFGTSDTVTHFWQSIQLYSLWYHTYWAVSNCIS